MSYDEYLLEQFEVKIIPADEYKRSPERVCFRTPLADYTLSKDDWEKVKEKLNKV